MSGRASPNGRPREGQGGCTKGALSAVIVHYDTPLPQLLSAVESLRCQTKPPMEVVVVDNSGRGALKGAAPLARQGVRVLDPGENVGYAKGVNLAAAQAKGEFFLTLNPDAQVHRDCLAHLLRAAEQRPEAVVVGAQVLLAGGEGKVGGKEVVNAGANPLHPTGISPAGAFGEPRERGPVREIAVASGACCLFRTERFLELGGLVEEFFLFYDDPDFGWRALLAGYKVLFVPEALAYHSYEFGRRGNWKWFLLERNRLFALLANYEGRTLAVLGPALLLSELGILAVSARNGFLKEKVRSYLAVWRLRKRLRAHRAAVQRLRRQSDRETLRWFTVRLQNRLLPPPGPTVANLLWVPYLALAKPLLRRRPKVAAKPAGQAPTHPPVGAVTG